MFPNQDHGRLSVLEDGTLLVASVRLEDSGVYLCKGLSIAGTAVAKVRLEVQGQHFLPVVVSTLSVSEFNPLTPTVAIWLRL